ncbi:MAG: glycoside hydrolase family 3 N-terminal domain-containing protein [Bacteroidales bacterium]
MKGYYLKSTIAIGLLVSVILFSRFASVEKIEKSQGFRWTEKKSDPEFLLSPAFWVDSVLNSLTLEQRIAQLIMVAAYSNNHRRNEQEVTKLVKEYNIGGLVFFQGAPHRQAQLTNLYQSLSKTPLLIAMDAESGPGMRIDSAIRYPSQMMLGAIDDDKLIFDMGSQIAHQLKRLGVHINFAPVIDINNNPLNPVISTRSFGEDMTAVTRKSLFYMIGMENNGILAVAKHFPGHGDTEADSHHELPVIQHSKERLDSLELFPFRELIYNGLSGIMTAHLQIPALDSRDTVPASLSKYVIDSLLKRDMGFKGLIFTDALGMKGVSDHYKPVEAAEMALHAGNDILLMPNDVPGIIASLSKRVRQGKINPEEIDQRCRKVLAAKYWAGLNRYRPVELAGLRNDLNKAEYRLLQRKLTESSLTLLKNRNGILPLKNFGKLRVASVVFSNKPENVFPQTLQSYLPVTRFYIRGDVHDNVDSLFAELKKYNLVIASVHATDLSPAKQYGINDFMIGLVDSLSLYHEVVLDLFANPYVMNRFRHSDRLKAVLVSYDNSDLTQELSAQAICGAIGSGGIVPVSTTQWPALKSGLKMESLGRLKFTIPLEAGMSEDTLKKIDDIVNKAIESQAFPGCQVLVARKGRIIFNKAYGAQVYKGKQPVALTDLYDLASITKAAATTQAMMKLVDEGCLDISQKLAAYLPYLEQSNKKDLVIKDILLHQSGLLPFIQFYFATEEPVFKNQPMFTSGITDANPLKVATGQYLNRYTHHRSNIISENYSSEFPYQVADELYISRTWPDSMYQGIAASRLNKKEYVYSDLGFILFKRMIDSITGVPFDTYLDSVFYQKLGASSLCFNPLQKFAMQSIAPTEDDQLFRKQLIRGYVHDQRAAMFGGVSGHAGLFGNAVDLAKLFQMMLNNGVYGGERYISKQTIELFTSRQSSMINNRRGLGFDKPEPDAQKPGPACRSASSKSYGHSGFTGTMVWADPEYDLVYIFLSNRVYPDASNNKLVEMNVRTEVQQVVYNAIVE